MTEENKIALVQALEKIDTSQLKNLADKLGGTAQVMEFFESAFLYHAKGDLTKIKTAAYCLVGIKRALKRVDRQYEGDEILSQIHK